MYLPNLEEIYRHRYRTPNLMKYWQKFARAQAVVCLLHQLFANHNQKYCFTIEHAKGKKENLVEGGIIEL